MIRPTRAASDSSGFEVPMRLVGTMPAIEVTVNGKGPFLFGIDTGGQGTARIDPSVAKDLGLEASEQISAGDPSGRNPQALALMRLQSVEIAGLRFSDVQAAGRPLKSMPRTGELDGILTLGFFGDYLLTLDYPAKKVRVNKGDLPAANGADIISYKSLGGIPVVEVSLGERKADAHIDSGNMVGGFMLPAALAEKAEFVDAPVVVAHARSMSGEVEIKEGRARDTVRIGRYEFPQPTVTFPALGDSMNIGGKILSEFAISFDQKNSRLRLVRQNSTP